MSFLFARKTSEYIYILSDTKINCSDNGNQIIKRLKDKAKLLDNYGIIKNVIINNNLCIGCAGIIEQFNDLLKYIEDNKIEDIELIKNKALEIHRKYNYESDFIIGYVNNDKRHLYEVKYNRIKETDSCWIGVQECFNAFQKIRNNKSFIKNNYDSDFSEDFNKMHIDKKCFKKVLDLNIFPDYVGKYYIDCTYMIQEGFHYMERFEACNPSEQIVERNESVKFYETAENGGCSYVTFCEDNNFGIFYEQIKKKIIFEKYLSEEGYNHLRFPREIYLDD